jgi:LPXTG-site transpeptidase (sortase) family protein
MTSPKRPLKVFLCHAHADRDAVRALYARLTKDGVDAWLDKEKLLPGQDWELEIRKAVREADVVVVCLSKQFNQAGFRQKEVRLALDTAMEQSEGEIFIIPARLEDCDTLESLRKWHWVDLFDDDGYEKLVSAIELRAKSLGKVVLTSVVKSNKELEIIENGIGNYTAKIKLQTSNLETVFAFLENRLKAISSKRQVRTKTLDNYPDGIARQVTYSDTLTNPNRIGNKLIVKSNYHIMVYPGKVDTSAEEIIQMHQLDAIIFIGWETKTVFLELEYMPTWHGVISSIVVELYDLFGEDDRRTTPKATEPAVTSTSSKHEIAPVDILPKKQADNKSAPKVKRPRLKTEYVIAFIGAVATIIAGFLGSPLIEKWLTPTSTITPISVNSETTPAIVATPTVLPIYVWDLVLPCGHTPPDNQGNTRPNEEEIPQEYRPLLQTLQEVLPPPQNPKQAVRIQIPAIEVDAPVVQGDGWEQLKKGVGQRIGSVDPGDLGNVVLCAHNDVYGEIFRKLDQLNEGNKVVLSTSESDYTYSVYSTQIVDPSLVEVMASTPRPVLTLISAYPYLVDNKRLVVKAELKSNISLPIPKSVQIGVVAGHWGNDVGAVCPNGVTEVDVNIKIAQLVKKKLLELGYDVDLLKEFDPLLLGYKGAALISIHNDSCDYINEQASGFKVVASVHNTDSEKHLLSCLVDKYGSATGLVFHSGSTTFDMTGYHTFSEVDRSTPIIIIETGFLNLDYSLLTEQTDKVANGIVKGIICYK